MPVCIAAALTCPRAVSWAGLRWLFQGQVQPALMEEGTTGPDISAWDTVVPRRECVKRKSPLWGCLKNKSGSPQGSIWNVG